MALSGLQKIGIALGFIPVVSTIVGAIKAFVYFRRAEEHDQNLKEQIHLEKSANNIHEKALHIFKELEFMEISYHEKSIGNWSIVEMIPGINIIAAFLCLIDEDGYLVLSKAQQNIKEISPNEDRFKEYLMQRYHVEDNPNPVLIEAMEWIYTNLDIPSQNINFNTDNKIYYLNEIPDLINKCKEKSLTETDFKKVLANALEEIIVKREGDEEICKKIDRDKEACRRVGHYFEGRSRTSYLPYHKEATKILQDKLVLLKTVAEIQKSTVMTPLRSQNRNFL